MTQPDQLPPTNLSDELDAVASFEHLAQVRRALHAHRGVLEPVVTDPQGPSQESNKAREVREQVFPDGVIKRRLPIL